MLNNKKSLLQKARIAMLAIVTIIGFSGAFAMTPPHHKDEVTWGVVQTNSGSYQVTAITAGSQCLSSARICEVRSSVAPDPETHLISTEDATPVTDNPGTFVK